MSRFCDFCPEFETCGIRLRSREEQCFKHNVVKRKVKSGKSLEVAWFGEGQ